jgi:methylmalonyl-CoA mutase, N-terminal domain
MTNALERGAREVLARIDAAGGTLAAIESGLIEREIQESAYRAQQAVDAGRAVVVGVNKFQESVPSEKDSRPLFQIDPEVEARQIARLRALRASRDAPACDAALAAVARAAADGGNLVPPIVAAVEARATVGEVAGILRAAFGEYRGTA